MATTIKVPKRVAVDDLRKVIGDKATEAALVALFGPKAFSTEHPMRVERVTFENMLALSNGKTAPRSQQLPTIFRLYWKESPHARGRFAMWIRGKLAEIEAFKKGEATEVGNELWTLKAASPTVHQPRKKRHPKAHVPGEGSTVGMGDG